MIKCLRHLVVIAVFAGLGGLQDVAHGKELDRPNHFEPRQRVEPNAPSGQGAVSTYMKQVLHVEDTRAFNLTEKFEPLKAESSGFYSPLSIETISQLFRALVRDSYNNALIVAKAGVGKSFLVRQLVALFSFGVYPDYVKDALGLDNPRIKVLREAFIGNVDIILVKNELLSSNPAKPGMPYDDAETRKKLVLAGLFEAGERQFKATGRRTLLLLDEVATLPPVVQETLKMLLDRTGFKDPSEPLEHKQDSGVSVLGMTTPDEVRRLIHGDSAIDRRYMRIDISEPTEEQALVLLQKENIRLKKKHGVGVEDAGLEYIISMRHLLTDPPLAMPGSVLVALDDLITSHFQKSNASSDTINLREAQDFVIKRAGLTDAWLPGPNGEPPFYDLEERVKKLVADHEDVIERVARVIKAWARLGFGGDVPVFILGGPSGSGKDTIFEAFSQVMFGHKGRHLIKGIGGIGGFGIEALTEGPPIGNHDSGEAPLFIKSMEENRNMPGFIGFNEGKDAPSKELSKLKVFIESAVFKPRGNDSRERPIRFPIWILGQWGEELFDKNLSDGQIDEVYARLTQEDIDDSVVAPKNKPDGIGAMEPALLKRAKKNGGVFLVPPVRKSDYIKIVDIAVAKSIAIQKKANSLDLEVSLALRQRIVEESEKRSEGTRELGAMTSDLTTVAISETSERGIPLRGAKLKLDVNKENQVTVTVIDLNGVETVVQTAPIEKLIRTKSSCAQKLTPAPQP